MDVIIIKILFIILFFVDLAGWRKMEMQQQQMEKEEVQMAEPATTTTSLLQEETEKMDSSDNTSSSPKKDDGDHQSPTKKTTEQACVKVGDHIILCVNEEKYTFAEVLPSGSVGPFFDINLLKHMWRVLLVIDCFDRKVKVGKKNFPLKTLIGAKWVAFLPLPQICCSRFKGNETGMDLFGRRPRNPKYSSKCTRSRKFKN